MPHELTYDELKNEILRSPTTWLPALSLTTAQAAIDRGVFKPGALTKAIQQMEVNVHGISFKPDPERRLSIDEFAAAALTGLIAGRNFNYTETADAAYKFAEAMIHQSNRLHP